MGRYLNRFESNILGDALSTIREGEVVIDVAAGSGRLAIPIRDKGLTTIAVDLDRQPLQLLSEARPDIPCYQASATAIPLASTQASALVAIQMFEYLDRPCLFLQEARRVLKDDGFMVISVGNRRSIKGMLYGRYLRLKGRKRELHYYERSFSEICRLFERCGFNVEVAYGYNWNVLPRDSDSRLISVFAWLEKRLGLTRLTSLSPWVICILRKKG